MTGWFRRHFGFCKDRWFHKWEFNKDRNYRKCEFCCLEQKAIGTYQFDIDANPITQWENLPKKNVKTSKMSYFPNV